MKKFLCAVTLLICMAPLAQAQVYFPSGSARPNNPEAARRDVERRPVQRRPVVKGNRVRCRDGSVHTARVCQRHRGIARR
ncbi:MAG: hypothetical protein H7327_04280 [Herminiimonas sp.]|nr:hypothetical protein [Herminiimonas sp.]